MSTNETIKTYNEEVEAFYKEAFTNPVTRIPYEVPEDIKKASIHICQAYNIKGLSDPMYIANSIALEEGRGDGRGNFFPKKEAV